MRVLIRGLAWLGIVPTVRAIFGGWVISRFVAKFAFLLGLAGILIWEWRQSLRSPDDPDQRLS